MAIINFNSISGVSTISVASSITVGNNVSIGTDRVTATGFVGNVTGNVTGTVNSSGIATFSSGLVVSAGSNSAPSISPSGDSNTGIFFPSADTIAFAEGGVEAARFDSSGRLGIGTDNPSQKLEVVGGEIKAGRVDSTNEGGQVSFGRATDNATAWYMDVYGNTSTPSLRFVDVSNGVVRATIDGSGRLTNPYQICWAANAGASNNFSSGTVTLCSSSTNSTSITTNVGSHFSASTGRFTAPVAGNYFFTAEFSPGNAASGPAVYITKNGNKITSYSYAYSVAYGTASISVVANCAVNDYLEAIVTTFNSQTTSVYGCSVSGFLIG